MEEWIMLKTTLNIRGKRYRVSQDFANKTIYVKGRHYVGSYAYGTSHSDALKDVISDILDKEFSFQ